MKNKFLIAATCVLLFIIWQYAGKNNQNVRLLVSTPSLIYTYFEEHKEGLLTALLVTLFETFSGLFLATLFSFIMMLSCFYKPNLLKIIMPVMVAFQVIPLIVLAPFFILIFGMGLTSKIALAALISFFPIFIKR